MYLRLQTGSTGEETRTSLEQMSVPYSNVAQAGGAPSRKAPVDLGPYLSRIIVVWPIDLPSRASLPLSLRCAPVNHGLMCLSQSRIESPMHGHRHLPCWQSRRFHSSGKRARDEQLDSDLDMRHVVPVQHNIAAATGDPACVQARPHLITEFSPQRRELPPRGHSLHHRRRASFDDLHRHLIAHASSCLGFPSFARKTLH